MDEAVDLTGYELDPDLAWRFTLTVYDRDGTLYYGLRCLHCERQMSGVDSLQHFCNTGGSTRRWRRS